MKIVKTIEWLQMIANKEKLPKKVLLLSPEIEDEYRILTYKDGCYVFKDGEEFSIIPEYLHLNDKVVLMYEEV